jgi:hypothetical protein
MENMKSKTATAHVKDREHEAVECEQKQPHVASASSPGKIR